jgi:hypothetical protein
VTGQAVLHASLTNCFGLLNACGITLASPSEEERMNTDYFFAVDDAGNRCRVDVLRACDVREREATLHDNAPVYLLEDGSRVHRVDRDTFRVLGTGAFITVLRE